MPLSVTVLKHCFTKDSRLNMTSELQDIHLANSFPPLFTGTSWEFLKHILGTKEIRIKIDTTYPFLCFPKNLIHNQAPTVTF